MGTQHPLEMQPIALMAAHGQAGSRGRQTPTPWQTLNSTTRWIHTKWGGGRMGHTWTKNRMGRTYMHVMRGGCTHAVGRQTQG